MHIYKYVHIAATHMFNQNLRVKKKKTTTTTVCFGFSDFYSISLRVDKDVLQRQVQCGPSKGNLPGITNTKREAIRTIFDSFAKPCS